MRTYTATLRSDGRIDWSGTTLNLAARHTTISSGTLSEGALSFGIDDERNPQSDVSTDSGRTSTAACF